MENLEEFADEGMELNISRVLLFLMRESIKTNYRLETLTARLELLQKMVDTGNGDISQILDEMEKSLGDAEEEINSRLMDAISATME